MFDDLSFFFAYDLYSLLVKEKIHFEITVVIIAHIIISIFLMNYLSYMILLNLSS